jgi:hypothetical protein
MTSAERRAGPFPGTTALRIRYAEREGLSVGELQEHLAGLAYLFAFEALTTRSKRRAEVRQLYFPRWYKEPSEIPTRELVFHVAGSVAYTSVIVYVHYNPVLEIVLIAGAIGGGSVALWQKYSKARVKAAEADIKEAEADEARAKARTVEDREKLRQDIILDMRLELESQRLRKMQLDVDDPAMQQLLQTAAREILAIDSIEVIDTDRKEKEGTDTV